MRRLTPVAILLAISVWASSIPDAAAPTHAGAIGVAGRAITVDGKPTFLQGVSLFDALGTTPPRDEDLDQLRAWHVNVVRVWAHWTSAIYGRDGRLTPDGRTRLAELVRRLDMRGLMLELVLLRPGQLPGQKFTAFDSADARVVAVGEIATALKNDRGVLFDLYNEHDHPDGSISHADARVLRDAVKAIDPRRIVTISSIEGHLVGADGRVSASNEAAIRAEAGRGAGEVGVDVIAAHLTRSDDWAAATGRRVKGLRDALDRLGFDVPIYLDEENRSFAPQRLLPPDTYVDAARNARAAGAAGWMFHTAAGFRLADKPFTAALLPNERDALSRVFAPR